MDDVYERLLALKAPSESFSETIRRITSNKGSIMELAGAWKDMSDEEVNKMKSTILRMRKGNKLQELKKKMDQNAC